MKPLVSTPSGLRNPLRVSEDGDRFAGRAGSAHRGSAHRASSGGTRRTSRKGPVTERHRFCAERTGGGAKRWRGAVFCGQVLVVLGTPRTNKKWKNWVERRVKVPTRPSGIHARSMLLSMFTFSYLVYNLDSWTRSFRKKTITTWCGFKSNLVSESTDVDNPPKLLASMR